VTKALDFSLADRKAELLRWLSEEGRFAPDTGRLLEMLCEKLTLLGAPIGRATVHVRTLHPEFRGVTRIWRRGQSTEIRTSRHGFEYTSDYQNSPVQYVIETGQWLDTVLSEATDRRFPILAALRAQGITHYVMAPLIFSNRIVNAISWGSDTPSGFREADVRGLVRKEPAWAPAMFGLFECERAGQLAASRHNRPDEGDGSRNDRPANHVKAVSLA
jgi:adenylate cyclase